MVPPSQRRVTGKQRLTMKLIGSNTSPYVRKVRVVMAEKKLDYQYLLEDPWSAQTQIGHSNPLGKVPCLVMEGAGGAQEALFDSRVIVEYLDTLSPVGKLIPSAGRERVEVKTWEALADGLLDAAITARLEATLPIRKEGERSQAWIDRNLSKIDAALKAMSTGLADKPFCSGIHMSLSDISVGCALGYLDFRFPQIDWRAHGNLARLYDKLSQRQSFVDTQPG
jgi:glutathione S-transferase